MGKTIELVGQFLYLKSMGKTVGGEGIKKGENNVQWQKQEVLLSLTFFAKRNSCLYRQEFLSDCSRFTIRQRIVICLAGKIVDQKKKVVLFYPFIVVIIGTYSTRLGS